MKIMLKEYPKRVFLLLSYLCTVIFKSTNAEK